MDDACRVVSITFHGMDYSYYTYTRKGRNNIGHTIQPILNIRADTYKGLAIPLWHISGTDSTMKRNDNAM